MYSNNTGPWPLFSPRPFCLSTYQLRAIVSNVSSALMSINLFSFTTYPMLVDSNVTIERVSLPKLHNDVSLTWVVLSYTSFPMFWDYLPSTSSIAWVDFLIFKSMIWKSLIKVKAETLPSFVTIQSVYMYQTTFLRTPQASF